MSWKTVSLDCDMYTYEYFLQNFACRICWCQNGEKEIVFSPEKAETNAFNFAGLLEYFGVDPSLNTRLTKVCSSCWNEVQNFYEFRSFCVLSQQKLNEILTNGPQQPMKNQDSISIDDCDPYTNDFSTIELEDTINDLFEGSEQYVKQKKIKKVKSETYCTTCKTDLGSLESFAVHNIEIHGLKDGLHNCFGCERTFKHRKLCLRHETDCKALKSGYKCQICDKFMRKRCYLENHLRAHKENKQTEFPEEIFKCKKCVEEFMTIEALNQHIVTHKDKKIWVCDTCGKVFLRRDYLYKHKLIHEGKKLHVCPYCKFRTIQKSSLNVHIRTHTGERPHACALCPQRCVNSSNLREHMKRHLGLKCFQCQLCDKKFGYKTSLEEHISSIHERSEVHTCMECGATYTRFRGLQRHLAAKHGKQVKKTNKVTITSPVTVKENDSIAKNMDGTVFLLSS